MRIIEGTNVDLISPFPLKELGRTYGWMHCYRTVTESDDSPKTMDEYIQYLTTLLAWCPSWGIIDKHQLTNIKHEAPLVGIGIFEPIITPWNGAIRNGYLHVATARKCWKTGLADEAAIKVIDTLFAEVPTLIRVSAAMLEKNYPAKALARRVGFKFEGLLEDVVLQGGSPQNMVQFGLTRRNHECLSLQQVQTPSGILLEDSEAASLVAPDQKVVARVPPLEPQILVEQVPLVDKPQALDSKQD